MEWLGKNKNAIAILRVSSYRQTDNTSHEVQESEVRRYCEKHGLSLARVEAITESAKDSEDRKKYHALIEWALKSQVRHVVYYMQDRETRNHTDLEATEKLILQDRIVVHYVRDQKVLWHGSATTEFVMREIQATLDKDHSRKTKLKVLDSMRTKAEAGWYPSNNPPLGYAPLAILNDDGKERKRGKIVGLDPNPLRVRQVQREFELRAQGLSFEEIRARIIAEGFLTSKEAKAYHSTGIEGRMKMPFYRGQFVWQGVTYQGKHDRIIPQSILDAVDKTLYKKNFVKREIEAGNIFSGGFIKCADPACGCFIVSDKKIKKVKSTGVEHVYHYYRCTNSKRVHPTLTGITVTERQLWEQFEGVLEKVSISEQFAKEVAAALNETSEKGRDKIKREAAGYQAALKALEIEEDALYRDLRKGMLTENAYQRQLGRLREDRARFGDLLKQANLAIHDAGMETVTSILELAKDVKTLWKKADLIERRERLAKLLSNPVLDGTTVRYEIQKPFRVLSEMASSEKWRTLEGSNL